MPACLSSEEQKEAREAYYKAWKAQEEAKRAHEKAERTCGETWEAYKVFLEGYNDSC